MQKDWTESVTRLLCEPWTVALFWPRSFQLPVERNLCIRLASTIRTRSYAPQSMVRFFFGNFWQGQDGRAFDFLACFLFVGYLGPTMSSKFWQVIPQQFKGAWFTPHGFLGAFFVWFAWKPQKTVTVRSCVSHDICVSKLGLLDTFSWSTIRWTSFKSHWNERFQWFSETSKNWGRFGYGLSGFSRSQFWGALQGELTSFQFCYILFVCKPELKRFMT